MPDPLPLACSLTAADAAQRSARWQALLREHLTESVPTPTGRRLTFPADASVAAEVDALVAAERECCPFLTLTVSHGSERVVLHAEAPAEARPILEAMLA